MMLKIIIIKAVHRQQAKSGSVGEMGGRNPLRISTRWGLEKDCAHWQGQVLRK